MRGFFDGASTSSSTGVGPFDGVAVRSSTVSIAKALDASTASGSDVSTAGASDVSTAWSSDVSTAGASDVSTAGASDVSTAGAFETTLARAGVATGVAATANGFASSSRRDRSLAAACLTNVVSACSLGLAAGSAGKAASPKTSQRLVFWLSICPEPEICDGVGTNVKGIGLAV